VEELKAQRRRVQGAAGGTVAGANAVTAAWIAEHLHMGTRGHLTHLLYHRNQAKPWKRVTEYVNTMD